MNSIKNYGQLLIRYVRPHRGQALLLFFLLITYTGLQLVSPLILGRFIDSVMTNEPMSELRQLAILFILLSIFVQVVVLLETYVAENLGWKTTNQLRSDVTLHCLNLDMKYHNEHTPGEMIERIDGDVTALGNFFSRFVVYLIGSTLLVSGVLILMARVFWPLGAMMTGISIIGLIIIIMVRNVAVPYWTKALEVNSSLFGFLEEHISGMEDIRTNNAIVYSINKLHQFERQLIRRQVIANIMTSLTGSSSRFFFTLGTAGALLMIAYLSDASLITLGTAYLIYRYTEMLVRPIEEINRQAQDFQKAIASIIRVQELLNVQSNVVDGSETLTLTSAPAITFEDVSFSYTDDANLVLENISFQLASGQSLGIVGRTGSGKTTISRLLFRLYDATNGAICLNGENLQKYQAASLVDNVGLVTQDVQLFHATVRDNLTFFNRAIPDHKIVSIIEQVGLQTWFESLPSGLDTMLRGNNNLSSGEAQLLAFARIFLKDPHLIILDEASSRLDAATENQMDLFLRQLLSDKTCIIIAHRLETLKAVDMILILSEGQIIEYGLRQDLVNNPNSHFSRLLQIGMEATII